MTHPQPPADAPFDLGPVGFTGAGVVERAYEQGVADARAGVLDTYSFIPGSPPPHVEALNAEAERVLAELANADLTRIEAVRGRVARHGAERDAAAARVAELEERYDEAVRDVAGIRTRIDALARDEERRRRKGLMDEGDSAEERPGGVDAAGPEAARWEGPYTAPPLPVRMKYTILATLVAIDIPIQWTVFAYFHGDTAVGQTLTTVFALSVAAIMVLLPHLAGYLYRGRHTTGEERPVILFGLILLLPGLYLGAVLGYLRARVLLVPPSTIGEDGRPTTEGLQSAAEPLQASDFSVIALFVMLLFITSGISFLIGTARFHPLRAAFEKAAGRRDRLSDELAAARSGLVSITARRDELEAACARLEENARQRLGDDREAVTQTYRAARVRYLDGAAAGLADPKATEAVAELIRSLP